jgi:hypothetical protein
MNQLNSNFYMWSDTLLGLTILISILIPSFNKKFHLLTLYIRALKEHKWMGMGLGEKSWMDKNLTID